MDHLITGVEFILNVENVAKTGQPETDRLLHKIS